MFNRPIQVYHYSMDPMNTFQRLPGQGENEPIRISYHRNVHYNSVVDPFKATIGVGLGLPGFKPGLADKTLMEKAIRISEQHQLEQVNFLLSSLFVTLNYLNARQCWKTKFEPLIGRLLMRR